MYEKLEKMLEQEKEKYEKTIKNIEEKQGDNLSPQDCIDYWYGKLDAIAEVGDFINFEKEA